jgi:hypothetical protein
VKIGKGLGFYDMTSCECRLVWSGRLQLVGTNAAMLHQVPPPSAVMQIVRRLEDLHATEIHRRCSVFLVLVSTKTASFFQCRSTSLLRWSLSLLTQMHLSPQRFWLSVDSFMQWYSCKHALAVRAGML